MRRFINVSGVMLLLLAVSSCGTEKNVIGYDAEEKFDDIKIIDINLTEEDYGIGVDKDQPELLEAVNSFIKEYETNGKFQEICDHYAGGEPVGIISQERGASKDQLIVATTGDFKPFDYVDGDINYGIDKEYVAALADYLDKELVLEYVNFDIMFMTVARHKADICIAGITINDARKKYVDFSDPYYHAGQIIVTSEKNTLFDGAQNAADVEKILNEQGNQLRVAVESMTIGQYYCEGNSEFGYQGFPVALTTCSNLEVCLEELERGNVDVVIGDAAVLKYLLTN